MKHTKLPWDCLDSTTGDFSNVVPCADLVQVTSDGLSYLGEILKKEDAAFIVKACNNHYQILEALTQLVKKIENPQVIKWTDLTGEMIDADKAIKEAE